jgi:hypothetical protein
MPNYQDKIEWTEPERSNRLQGFYIWSKNRARMTEDLAELFEPTELEKQYSKLESKAERHGKRVVIWVKCPTCGTVGEYQDPLFRSINSVSGSPGICRYCHSVNIVREEDIRLGTGPITWCQVSLDCTEKLLYVWKIKEHQPNNDWSFWVGCKKHIEKFASGHEYVKLKKIDTFVNKITK